MNFSCLQNVSNPLLPPSPSLNSFLCAQVACWLHCSRDFMFTAQNFSGKAAAWQMFLSRQDEHVSFIFFPQVGTSSRWRDSDGRLLSHDFCLLSCSQMGFFETFIQRCVQNPQPGTPDLQNSSPARRMPFKSTIHGMNLDGSGL